MKVLDVNPFHEGVQRNVRMLSRLESEMQTIAQTVEGLVAMEESLKGEGGNAIRMFYRECHLPFLQFFTTFQSQFSNTLKQMESALDTLEPIQDGFIRESYLEGEVEEGLNEIKQLTERLMDEANSIMNEVADIVDLPHLDDSEVQEGIGNAKNKRDDTVTQLNEFDTEQTVALTPIETDLNTMITWVSDIESLFVDGVTVIDFNQDKWVQLAVKNTLKTDLAQRIMGTESVVVKTDMNDFPGTMFGTAFGEVYSFKYKPNSKYEPAPLYGTGTSAYSYLQMSAVKKGAASFSNRAQYKKVGNPNPFVKSWNSFKEIGSDFTKGLETRADKAFESPYDFVNYMTIGVSDGLITGAKERAGKAFDTPYDFTNWLTLGFADTVKGAVAPEDPYSKDHWLASFGVATVGVGGVKPTISKGSVGGGKGKGTSSTGVNTAKKPKEVVKPVDDSLTYYRVQGGGEGFKSSQYRIQVNKDGTINVPNKNADLNVSAYDFEHAKYFRDSARPGGEIIEFKVPKELDDLVKETRIPQYGYSKNPLNQGGTAPKIVDPTTPGTSYELPAPWVEWIEEYGHSAKKIE